MRNYLVIPKTLSKYRNIQTEYNGFKYMSKKEAEYAMTLDSLKRATNKKDRVISFEKQIPFQIEINGIKVFKYIADFKVFYADDRVEIIDVKGVRTDVYRLKKKCVEAQYGIKIIEV